MYQRIQPISSVMFGLVLSACGSESGPAADPPGSEETARTEVLETGAMVLQKDGPLDPFNVYLVGFHPMKQHPAHQMEAHHICDQVNQDFAQCVLFDGNTENANLTGVEYIISEKLFKSLPDAEKRYWHPHNYEILSGQLVAPGLPDIAENQLMKTKMNSYGKTWHFWRTGMADGEGDALPLGEPDLAWSFNRDGEINPQLLDRLQQQMGIDTRETRKQRQDLVELAHPQHGVNALKDDFEGPTSLIPGVEPAQAPEGR